MALNDDATLIVGYMNFFTAPVGTPKPTAVAIANADDLATVMTGWSELGHTSLDSPLKITAEGGDVSTKGSLQNHALRTVVSDKVSALELDLQQFDKESIKLFLGGNSVEDGDLVYAQEKPRATTRALFGVGYDGDNIFLVHGPKTDITANGDFEAADTESLSSLPIKFTFLKEASAKGTFGLSPVLKIADLVTP